MGRSSRVLQHGNPIFFQKSLKLNFVLCRRAEFSLASSISVLHWCMIVTSMERSSRVLQHGNIFFFQESSKLNFDLYFYLCQRAEIIQVSLNMHLYDDIGDASFSLRGSTSSYTYFDFMNFLSIDLNNCLKKRVILNNLNLFSSV